MCNKPSASFPPKKYGLLLSSIRLELFNSEVGSRKVFIIQSLGRSGPPAALSSGSPRSMFDSSVLLVEDLVAADHGGLLLDDHQTCVDQSSRGEG